MNLVVLLEVGVYCYRQVTLLQTGRGYQPASKASGFDACEIVKQKGIALYKYILNIDNPHQSAAFYSELYSELFFFFPANVYLTLWMLACLWRNASYITSAAETEAFNELILPHIGIEIR